MAPFEPLFFLHHAMVDYTYALWLRDLSGKNIPDDYNSPLPRPYRYLGLNLEDTFDTSRFCYRYADPVQTDPSQDSYDAPPPTQTAPAPSQTPALAGNPLPDMGKFLSNDVPSWA